MEQYLDEIKYFVSHILEITWRDHDEAHRLAHELRVHTAATHIGYAQADAIGINAEDSDDVAMASGRHWETYFTVDKRRHEAERRHDELAGRLYVRKFSTAAAAGAVLQHAKQGISIVHGAPANCPDGRMVTATQSLRTVIWEGRNQAIHWEEGKLSQRVLDCFNALSSEHHTRFGKVYGGSLAFHVLSLLGWRSWDDFRADLLSLR
jgi:hypothetical protein